MEAVAELSRRCKDPVYHLIVAYARGEHPTREQVVSGAERLLKAIGMERSQYVLAAHQDTENYHAHVVANRIRPDGKANDLWQERIKRERVCAEIAAERGWEIVVGRHNRDIVQRVRHLYAPPAGPEHRLSDGAYRQLRERGELPWQESARPYVLDTVDRAKDWSDLHQRLAAHGVVAKLVRRGERIRGLAFAEGLDRSAPGCAASRIDPRCALPALERRFGPFTPSHELAKEPIDAARWVQSARPKILTAVDGARSWDELTQQLDRDGMVVKLIARGTRVQGLAFAQGRDPGAPGCGASRIHPRCKKAALEQRLGPCPFATPEQPPKRSRSSVRDRAEHEAHTDPRWALRDAQRIVDHARTRSEYAGYRDRFFGERHAATAARREAAWEREHMQRRCEAKRRREARLLLRAVARLAARGAVARQLAYWSIDTIINRRRAHEYDAGRVRWEATKIVLASERRLMREEKPMDYRSFVAQRARIGDLSAQRVLDGLEAPARRHERSMEAPSQPVTLAEVRERLTMIRAEEEARRERARVERAQLMRVEKPPTIEQVFAEARNEIQTRVGEATQFTPAERAALARLTKEQQSWNPFARKAATKEAMKLRDGQQARYEAELAKTTRDFESANAKRVQERIRSDERIYREYVSVSLGLEDQMRQARAVLRDEIPKVEKQLTVLDRSGVAQLECEGGVWGAGVDKLAAAVDRPYQALPKELRQDVEFAMRREQRALRRSRESIPLDR
jgi:Relaxase/Mobilisation nuclease domain